MSAKVVFAIFFSRILIVGTIILSACAASVLAHAKDQSDWHFTGSQKPDAEILWPLEDQIANPPCSVQIRSIFDNYVRLHPGFRRHVKNETMRRGFRQSLILGVSPKFKYYGYDGRCFVDMLDERIRKYELENRVSTDPLVLPFHYVLEVIGWKRRPRNLFCGVMAKGLYEQELYVAWAQEELMKYAIAGNWSAIASVMWNDRRTVFFRFNPDVRYYLQTLLTKLTPTKEILEINAPLMLPLDELSSQRRKFVEEAFERRDYQAVLDTTDPCQT